MAWFRARSILISLLVGFACANHVYAGSLPDGFVQLQEVDPSIVEDIRYAGSDNFTGAPVPGYRGAQCLLARKVAMALAGVQADLRRSGFGLKVFDCYRPSRAVRHFLAWSTADKTSDPAHHPRVARHRLVAEGYIGRRSGHSSGGSVDLTLVRLSGDGPTELDMGTIFDFFDPAARTENSRLPRAIKVNRARLLHAMQRHGFINYRREWWHFRYEAEPFPGRVFDFEIPAVKP
jgi:D-alanyl-D-alanine dipeptidase